MRQILLNFNYCVPKYDFAPSANRACGDCLMWFFVVSKKGMLGCFPKDIPLSIMRTDDRADLAVPTNEYPTPDSKILVRNSTS